MSRTLSPQQGQFRVFGIVNNERAMGVFALPKSLGAFGLVSDFGDMKRDARQRGHVTFCRFDKICIPVMIMEINAAAKA